LRGDLFRRRLETLLPVSTFAACRVPLAISVFDVFGRRTVVKDAGPLAEAIHASCAVPLMFQPVWIAGRPFLDVGLGERAGLAGLELGVRILYHHIASRSPWRSARSQEPPSRAAMATLILDDLPRSGPFRLDAGRRAFVAARS